MRGLGVGIKSNLVRCRGTSPTPMLKFFSNMHTKKIFPDGVPVSEERCEARAQGIVRPKI